MEGPLVEYNQGAFGKESDFPIAYLDRDGVLNYGSPEYIKSPNELEIISGVKESISKLRSAGYRIVIVTNQSPISRGLYDVQALEKIHTKLQYEIGIIDVIMTCPHKFSEKCRCRKPHPGMLNHASELLRSVAHTTLDWWGNKPSPINVLDLMVGDRKSDMGAGWAVGARLFHVDSELGLPSVIHRILSNDEGDEFNPVG
ncbi:MAG: HAD-IIIA family hydrolase [Candidatus Poseidoniaceae archaeon]|nr:HAD-IIIA family hydrolase [Candidatus Poseidoniaceae archaeon]